MILTNEQVQALTEDYDLEEILGRQIRAMTGRQTAEDAIHRMNERNAEAERALRAAGVDVDKIKSQTKSQSEKIAANLKRKGVREDIVQIARETHKSLLETFLSMYHGAFNSQSGEMQAGLAIFFTVLVVNTAIMTIVSIIAGPGIGMAFTAIVVAPIVEEGARRTAIRQGKGLSAFTAMINGYEFVTYVMQMLAMGVPMGIAVTIRGTLAVFHQFMGAMQKWGYERDIANGVAVEDAGKTEFILAILFHAINNAFGGLFWMKVFPSAFKEAVLVGDDVFFM